MDTARIERFAEAIERIRKERDWSRERLSHEAWNHEREGTSSAQLEAIETGVRRPSAQSIAGFSAALGIPPETFIEYRLACARHRLDEREPPKGVGFELAVENLSRVEPLLRGEDAEPVSPAEALAIEEAAAGDHEAGTRQR